MRSLLLTSLILAGLAACATSPSGVKIKFDLKESKLAAGGFELSLVPSEGLKWPPSKEAALIARWHQIAAKQCGGTKPIFLQAPYALQSLSGHQGNPVVHGVVSVYGRFSCR